MFCVGCPAPTGIKPSCRPGSGQRLCRSALASFYAPCFSAPCTVCHLIFPSEAPLFRIAATRGSCSAFTDRAGRVVLISRLPSCTSAGPVLPRSARSTAWSAITPGSGRYSTLCLPREQVGREGLAFGAGVSSGRLAAPSVPTAPPSGNELPLWLACDERQACSSFGAAVVVRPGCLQRRLRGSPHVGAACAACKRRQSANSGAPCRACLPARQVPLLFIHACSSWIHRGSAERCGRHVQ